MFQQIIHILLTSVICIIWGIPVLIASKRPGSLSFWFRSTLGQAAFLFFCGTIALSFLSSWICLILPLRFNYLLIITGGLIIYLFMVHRHQMAALFLIRSNDQFSFSLIEWLYLGACLLIFFLLSSLQPANLDTQIYHLQIIRWQSEYGVVPGTANLFARFGLGSNWFNLISFFYVPGLKSENYSYFNASFVSWFFIWLFTKCNYYFSAQNEGRNKHILAFFYLLLFLFFMYDWQLFRDAANSTNYDFAVIAFMIIVLSYFIEKIIEGSSGEKFSFLIVLLALTIPTFKFSGIFILLAVGYYLLQYRQTGLLFKTCMAGVLILLPVFVKNYFVTGYPLYPLPWSVGDADWRLPKELTTGIYHYIMHTNRYYNFSSVTEPASAGVFDWASYWWRGILLQHKVILLIALSACSLFFLKPVKTINPVSLRLFLSVIFAMIAGWFFSAPDPGRFGYGVLLPAAFLTVSIYAGPFIKKIIYPAALLISLLPLVYYGYRKAAPLFENKQYLLYPVPVTTPAFRTLKVKGLQVHFPEIIPGNWDHRCFGLPLPCTAIENSYLEPRGSSLNRGFRMKPYPDSLFLKNYTY